MTVGMGMIGVHGRAISRSEWESEADAFAQPE